MHHLQKSKVSCYDACVVFCVYYRDSGGVVVWWCDGVVVWRLVLILRFVLTVYIKGCLPTVGLNDWLLKLAFEV